MNIQVTVHGIAFDVEGTYTPEESGMGECPDSPAEFEIDSIHIDSQDATELVEWYDLYERIMDAIWAKHK